MRWGPKLSSCHYFLETGMAPGRGPVYCLVGRLAPDVRAVCSIRIVVLPMLLVWLRLRMRRLLVLGGWVTVLTFWLCECGVGCICGVFCGAGFRVGLLCFYRFLCTWVRTLLVLFSAIKLTMLLVENSMLKAVLTLATSARRVSEL